LVGTVDHTPTPGAEMFGFVYGSWPKALLGPREENEAMARAWSCAAEPNDSW
jgi:hypothetical protein